MSEQDDQDDGAVQELPLSESNSGTFPGPEIEGPLIPSPTEGKDPATGRFVAHNKYGRGNPVARQAFRIRQSLFAALTPELMTEATLAIIGKAIKGDVAAFKVLCEFTLGPPQALDLLHQVARLKGAILRGTASGFDAGDDQ
jgi:hypothetical protein